MRPSLKVSQALFLLALLPACHSVKPAPAVAPVSKSIGTAHLTKDGLLEVMLRAEGDGGMVGDAFFVYKKSTPEYAEMMKHIGGLKRGESKPVPAYP